MLEPLVTTDDFKDTIKEELMVILANEGLTLTDLATILTRMTCKKYTVKTLSQKLCRNTLRYCEFRLILDILDYKIEMTKTRFRKRI